MKNRPPQDILGKEDSKLDQIRSVEIATCKVKQMSLKITGHKILPGRDPSAMANDKVLM